MNKTVTVFNKEVPFETKTDKERYVVETVHMILQQAKIQSTTN